MTIKIINETQYRLYDIRLDTVKKDIAMVEQLLLDLKHEAHWFAEERKKYYIEVKRGIPLTTKEANRYTNAVVYDVNVSQHRCQVTVLTDFGNRVKFPSIEDMLEYYDISKAYLEYYRWSKELNIEASALDTQFCLRERLEKQIELLTEALEGLSDDQ